ncbi:nucleoside triphosphate pyrophosphohydrolase [Taibaiella soli]|uniref:Nucleoside triphosphate pyrophosphohydrolase n=1 Tax=Taibaiella soli TaxID=1649169 RepID=A0A2W2ABZ8_9BACT|nr:nucleoside triphosphate pyrophosphohydrolase [Taibaiella soli]PZF72811.1 nucleoside triphosphate pyrophosphohydrolase [Taibaiella soli]
MEYAQSLERLRNILDELREKCPWDKKQTIHTLRQQTIEETYELADAITENDWKGLKEELGDLLLHILFYSKIGAEQNQFTLEDVIEGVCNKLVTRHPHIYSGVKVQDDEEVKQNWEKIKLKEGKKSVLAGVPPSLPAIMKALRLQDKTKQVGFEWDHIDQVKEKVDEEISELYEAIATDNPEEIEQEFGDVLFALVNYARFLKLDPEAALEKTNKKFIRRFQQMEVMAQEKGKQLHDMTLLEMDDLWNTVKATERN